MSSLLDFIGQLLGSSAPTLLACIALVAGGAFFYFKVLPDMEELKEFRKREAEGNLDSSAMATSIDELRKLVTKMLEDNPDSNSAKVLSDVLRNTHELERSLNALGRDTQFTTGVIRDLMQSVNDLHTELKLVRQKLHNISGAIYSTTGAHDENALGDLRSLR